MSLNVYIGPMFSGKTNVILTHSRISKVIKEKYVIIKPNIDNRYTKDSFIVSHNKMKESCIMVNDLKNIINNNIIKSVKKIYIDEAQFLNNLKEFVINCVDNMNKDVVIVGLDGDFMRQPMGEILSLIPYADNIIKLKAKCLLCSDGTDAIFTCKKVKDNKTVDVGSSDKYISLCRKHYLADKNKNISKQV